MGADDRSPIAARYHYAPITAMCQRRAQSAELIATTGTSSGTRQTVRGDADLPSTHSAADGEPVQHAAPSADRRRAHRGAADAPDRATGLQGTDTA